MADGLFLREPPQPSASSLQPPAYTLHPLPDAPLKPLEELFRAKVINLLVEQKLLPAERVQVLYSWKHSGFNVHAGERVPPEAKADLESLAQYILRNPFSVGRFFAISAPGMPRPPACPPRVPQGPTPTNRVGMWTRCPITKTC